MFFQILPNVVFLIIWAFMILMISGCSALGFNLSDTRTIAITKAPYQIVLSGDITQKDEVLISNLVNTLNSTAFKNYKFNENIKIVVVGEQSEINKINVNELKIEDPAGNDEDPAGNDEDPAGNDEDQGGNE